MVNDLIKQYYNEVRTNYGMNSLRRKKILELTGPLTGQRILDIGCASGYLSKELKQADNFVAGIDISSRHVQELMNDLDCFECLNIENDQWPQSFIDHKFDLVIMAEVIEHMFDPLGFMIKVKHILKDDGIMIITTPNFLLWNNRIRMLLGQYGEKEKLFDRSHINLMSYNGLEKVLKDAEFKIIEENNIWYPNKLEQIKNILSPNLFVFQSILKIKK